jgi:hypothetical protein
MAIGLKERSPVTTFGAVDGPASFNRLIVAVAKSYCRRIFDIQLALILYIEVFRSTAESYSYATVHYHSTVAKTPIVTYYLLRFRLAPLYALSGKKGQTPGADSRGTSIGCGCEPSGSRDIRTASPRGSRT